MVGPIIGLRWNVDLTSPQYANALLDYIKKAGKTKIIMAAFVDSIKNDLMEYYSVVLKNDVIETGSTKPEPKHHDRTEPVKYYRLRLLQNTS